MRKLIYISSHPIQYYAPLYKAIEESGKFDLEVWFCSRHGLGDEVDKEFGTKVKWDVPVLEGYKHVFLKNFLFKPNIYKFYGLLNLELITRLYKTPKSLVIVPGWKHVSYIIAIIFGKLFGHKLALRAETTIVNELKKSKRRRFLRKLSLRYFLFKFIDHFFYLGDNSLEFYKYYNIDDSKLIFTPYCVDNERFNSSYQSNVNQREAIREELGIDENEFVFIYCGKYIQIKRPLDLLKAFNKVEDMNSKLIMVGEGAMRSDIEGFIEKNPKLKDRVILTGFVNQTALYKYYTIGDALVLCSESETWGLVVNEAMNFGLPVISSNTVGASRSLIDENENGYIYTMGDVDGLHACMERMLENPNDKIKNMREASLEKIKEFSYDTMIDNIIESEI